MPDQTIAGVLFNLFSRRYSSGKCDKSEKAQGSSGQMRRVQFVMAIEKVVGETPMLKGTSVTDWNWMAEPRVRGVAFC